MFYCDTKTLHEVFMYVYILIFISQFRFMGTYTGDGNKSQDALAEVMILVKEEAKSHDLNSLIDVS